MIAPLKSIKVVEVSAFIVGPLAGAILAQLGAEVTKVEPPTGDPMRQTSPGVAPDLSTVYLYLNHGKRSLAIDLKTESGQIVIHKLVAEADVFLHNLSDEAVGRLGLDYADLSATNPGLVYCAIRGFGKGGPYSGRPAYDDTIQALSGMSVIQGMSEIGGKPNYIRTAVADKSSAAIAVYAITAALYRREKTGRGAEVEVPMFEAMVDYVMVEQMAAASFIPSYGPERYARMLVPQRRPFRCADGRHVSITPITDAHWRSLFKVVGRENLLADERLRSMSGRNSVIGWLNEQIQEALETEPSDHWLKTFESVGIPICLVNDPVELVDDEHLQAVGMFVSQVDHEGNGIRRVRSPVRFDCEDSPPLRTAVPIGFDTAQVLGDLGYESDEVARLIESGVCADFRASDRRLA